MQLSTPAETSAFRWNTWGVILLCCAAHLSAQPTENPVQQFYRNLDRYTWTDHLNWETVITTSAIPNDGIDDLPTVQSEIKTLSESGGGVLYFPAGTYDFADDLFVHDGVIIRGVQPADGYVADNLDPNRDPAIPVDEVDNAKSSLFSLETKFEFPKFIFDPAANEGSGNDRSQAFKAIRLNDPFNDSNAGICWIDINRARIEWIQYGEDPETGLSISYWGYFGIDWDPSLPFTDPSNGWRKIKSSNWVIFGNRINNAARWDNRPNVAPPVGSQDPWAIWPKRISAQIDTFNYANTIVANNRLMDKHYYDWDNSQPNGEQPGNSIDDFLMEAYKDKNGNVVGDIWFNYTAGHGIKMNRSLGLDGGDIPYTPDKFPMLFRRGIVCRDNWTFVTRRVGIYIGGDGAECIGNYRTDVSFSDGDPRKQAWVKASGNEAITFNGNTLENRGIDVTGTRVEVNYNYWEVYRHKMRDSGYYSTDGEGILHQEVGGGTQVDGWTISHNVGNAYIGIYKSRDIRRLVIEDNLITSVPVKGPSSVYVVADTNGAAYRIEDTFITGNTSFDGMMIKGTAGIQNVSAENNTISGGTLSYTHGVTLANNTGNLAELDDLPPSNHDFMADAEVVSPDFSKTFQPGETIEVTITASDGEGTPTSVSVWLDLTKLGEAQPTETPRTYTLEMTTPEEPGIYYYFVEVLGDQEPFWSPPIVLEVANPQPYTPQGWVATQWGWIEDTAAPWFYLDNWGWVYAVGFEFIQNKDAPGFYLYSYPHTSWAWSSGKTEGYIYAFGEDPAWIQP